MNRTSIRRAIVPGIAALAITLSACGAGNENTGGSGTDTNSGSADLPSEASGLTGELKGAGATSQEKAQEAWGIAIQGLNDGFTVDYQGVGSTSGREQFVDGGVSFAGSDSYMNDDEGQLTAAKERCGGEDVIEVPAYVSPIAIAFNLPGIDSLNLSPSVVADIFNNKITKWNDPAIAAENDGVDLPDADISPVHRSDDSGTTKNFTDYLGKAAPDNWSYEAEDAFPVSGGNSQAAEGTSGVVELMTGTENTIGYADESQIGELGTVSVKVGDEYVAPSAEGAAKTVAVSTRVEGRADVDMATDVDRTTTESGAYPVILLSYLIACQHYEDATEAANVKGYLSYIVSDAGQQEANEQAGSAPLTAETAAEAQEIVAGISAG